MSEIDIEAVHEAMLRLDHVCQHGTGREVMLVARHIDQLAKENERLKAELLVSGEGANAVDQELGKVMRERDQAQAYNAQQDLVIDTLRTKHAAMQEAIVEAESGWLIEESCTGITHWIALAENEWPRYRVTTRRARMNGDYDREITEWRNPVVRVKDAGAALRFARKEDAEAFITLFAKFLLHPKATEHQWVDSHLPTPKPAPADPLVEVVSELVEQGGFDSLPGYVDKLRAALSARGLEVRKIGEGA